MNKKWTMGFVLIMGACMLGFTGCGGGSGGGGGGDGGDGGGSDEVIVAKGTKVNLQVGNEEDILHITDQGTGTLSAEISWSTERRIQAEFTIIGFGSVIADTTTITSPLTISAAVEAGNAYSLYLGNPDGPDVIDVNYTVFFVPAPAAP